MREAEAARFVAANRGSGVCISYLRDGEGNVRFADSAEEAAERRSEDAAEDAAAAPIMSALVPVERLRRPAVRRAAAVAALALAACTPHAEHGAAYVESVDEVVMARSSPEIPLAVAPIADPGAEGEDRPAEPEVVEEPCDPEAVGEATATTAKKRTKTRVRGGLKRRAPAKTKPEWERFDGGI